VALFVVAFVVCFVLASILMVLHFQMKFRLYDTGLPVKWLMMPSDDFRMWRMYLIEAPRREWPVWPFYVYRALYAAFIVSGIVFFIALVAR
jgi:hypothetical protein